MTDRELSDETILRILREALDEEPPAGAVAVALGEIAVGLEAVVAVLAALRVGLLVAVALISVVVAPALVATGALTGRAAAGISGRGAGRRGFGGARALLLRTTARTLGRRRALALLADRRTTCKRTLGAQAIELVELFRREKRHAARDRIRPRHQRVLRPPKAGSR